MFDRFTRTTHLSVRTKACFSGFGKVPFPNPRWSALQQFSRSALGSPCGAVGSPKGLLLAFYELDSVAVGILDEKDSGPASHGVRLALEIHTPGFFEPIRKGVEVFDGEGDVAVAGPELVGFVLVVVEGELEARLGVAGHGEESVGRIVADGRLAGELQAKLVRIEIYAPVEIQDPVAGVYVPHRSLLSVAQHFRTSACQHFSILALLEATWVRLALRYQGPVSFATESGLARGNPHAAPR